eukprot:9339082-Pyramimonas_sp.AAC.1
MQQQHRAASSTLGLHVPPGMAGTGLPRGGNVNNGAIAAAAAGQQAALDQRHSLENQRRSMDVTEVTDPGVAPSTKTSRRVRRSPEMFAGAEKTSQARAPCPCAIGARHGNMPPALARLALSVKSPFVWPPYRWRVRPFPRLNSPVGEWFNKGLMPASSPIGDTAYWSPKSVVGDQSRTGTDGTSGGEPTADIDCC